MSVIRTIPNIIGNKYFIRNGRGGRRDYGGYSPGITGKMECFEGCTLNNCTSGAWGLFAMAEDNPDCKVGFIKYADRYGDARTWWNDGQPGKYDKYERGLEPKEGAIICYDGNEYGHVAYVSKIEGDRLTILSSGYGNTTPDGFNVRYVYKSDNYEWPTMRGFTFQGFIYPKCESGMHADITSDEAINKMAEDVIAGKYGNGKVRAESLYWTIQNRVNEILWGKK